MVEQSPTHLRSVSDWSLTVVDYSELVAHQSPTDRQLNAKQLTNVRQLVGDHIRSGKLVATVANSPPQALWDRGFSKQCRA